MQTYGSLNLKKIREDCGLDFAHFTYQRGQCSCCYGPKDMPARYWAKGKKPKMINLTYREDGSLASFQWDRKDEDIQYILFKNANNGSGIVTKNDVICERSKYDTWLGSSPTIRIYIEWQFPEEKMDQVLQALREQLDPDYVILRPENEYECIGIALRKDVHTPEDCAKVFVLGM